MERKTRESELRKNPEVWSLNINTEIETWTYKRDNMYPLGQYEGSRQ